MRTRPVAVIGFVVSGFLVTAVGSSFASRGDHRCRTTKPSVVRALEAGGATSCGLARRVERRFLSTSELGTFSVASPITHRRYRFRCVRYGPSGTYFSCGARGDVVNGERTALKVDIHTKYPVN
jgi:hypothetical protein